MAQRYRAKTTGARVVRTARGAGARDAKPRTAPMARRRDGDIAPYRNGGTRGAHATGPHHGAWVVCTRGVAGGAHGNGRGRNARV